MSDIAAATTALLGSLKAAAELGKSMLDVTGAVKVRDKVVELNGALLAAQNNALSAQTAQASLVARVHDLEAEVMELKNWEGEKQSHQLEEVRPGVFAYGAKPAVEGSGPKHHLCANCFQHRRKSILQRRKEPVGRRTYLDCPDCRTAVEIT
jgi:Zn finger protein HypA/HybF involved in hydrogenase expression